jgi:hypothetical protein
LCGKLGPTSSEGLAQEFCGSCHFLTALNNAAKVFICFISFYFFISKPASSHLVGLLAGQIDPFPNLNICQEKTYTKKKQTQKQDPHIHPRPRGNEPWGSTKKDIF